MRILQFSGSKNRIKGDKKNKPTNKIHYYHVSIL